MKTCRDIWDGIRGQPGRMGLAQPLRRGLNPLSAEPGYEEWYVEWFERADRDAWRASASRSVR